jgi:hypothetical protein
MPDIVTILFSCGTGGRDDRRVADDAGGFISMTASTVCCVTSQLIPPATPAAELPRRGLRGPIAAPSSYFGRVAATLSLSRRTGAPNRLRTHCICTVI